MKMENERLRDMYIYIYRPTFLSNEKLSERG